MKDNAKFAKPFPNENALYSRIEREIGRQKGPLIVGISGGYTSGKTVFAENLARYLAAGGYEVQVIHYDDFHRPLGGITWTGERGGEIDAFFNRAFDPHKLVEELLRPMKTDGFVDKDVACLNWSTGEYTNIVHFAAGADTVVLLEGVLLFRPPLMEYLDYRIFLDITTEEMLRRGRRRDVPRSGEWIMEKYVSRYIPVHQRHLEEDKPLQTADMVIDNNDYDAPVVR